MIKQEFLDGRIVLYNADSRDIDNKNYITVSDPPYNLNYHYNSYKDKLKDCEYLELLAKVFIGKCVIIHYPESLFKFSIHTQRHPTKFISWVYNCHTPKQHRGIAFYDIKVDLSQVKQSCKNLKDKRILAKEEPVCNIYDWWFVNQVKNVSAEKLDHPCQIPLQIMNNILLVGSSLDDIIFDPFLGSGTTAIASIRNNRRFVGAEIDNKYFDLSCKRIEDELRQGRLF